jgi:hypothetical protein
MSGRNEKLKHYKFSDENQSNLPSKDGTMQQFLPDNYLISHSKTQVLLCLQTKTVSYFTEG